MANIGTDEVILGMDWLQKHNPDIHWTKGVMTFWRGEQLQVATGTTWSQRIAEEQEKTRPKEEIPQEFQGFRKVFSEKESERMPTQKPYDHAINLVPGSKLPRSRRYPLGPKEEEALDKYLDKNLRKGYIWKSGSSATSPVF